MNFNIYVLNMFISFWLCLFIINKIALSSNDDNRIVALDGITSYPYGYVLKN